MNGFSGATSVINAVNASARVASLCRQYLTEDEHAKGDIKRLHQKIDDTKSVLKKLQQLLDKRGMSQLPTANTLLDTLEGLRWELRDLESTLERNFESSERRIAMQPFCLQTLKWPLSSIVVEKAVQNLEKYGQIFSLALQVDAM
jgi:hypothetical protein